MTRFLFVLTVSLFFSALDAQEKNADTLLKRAFNAIKTNNENAFARLFLSYGQIRGVLSDLIMEVSDTSIKSQVRKQLANLDQSQFQTKMLDEIKKNFSSCIDKLRAKGIELNHLQLSKIQYKLDTSLFVLPGYKLKRLEGSIFIRADEKDYQIVFKHVDWSNMYNGWAGITLTALKDEAKNTLDEIYHAEGSQSVKVKNAKVEMVPFKPPAPKN